MKTILTRCYAFYRTLFEISLWSQPDALVYCTEEEWVEDRIRRYCEEAA